MGARGPLPREQSRRGQRRTKSKPKKPRLAELEVITGHPEMSPAEPTGLGEAGRAAWSEAWACEWAHASDARAIEQLARMEDEREAIRTLIAGDYLLERPIVSPRGDVVGTQQYANPLLRELRRLDGPILTLRDRLGLSPLARARLGQAVVQLRKDENALERERIMARYRKAAIK